MQEDKIKKIINTSKSAIDRRMGIIEKLHRNNKKLRNEMLSAKEKYGSEIKKLSEELEGVKRLQAAAKSELKRMNPVHPFLGESATLPRNICSDPLRCRLSAPTFNWDDATDTGMVRMMYVDAAGHSDVIGYAFSEKAIYLHQSYILDNITQEFARCLYVHLSDCINKPHLRKSHESKG